MLTRNALLQLATLAFFCFAGVAAGFPSNVAAKWKKNPHNTFVTPKKVDGKKFMVLDGATEQLMNGAKMSLEVGQAYRVHKLDLDSISGDATLQSTNGEKFVVEKYHWT